MSELSNNPPLRKNGLALYHQLLESQLDAAFGSVSEAILANTNAINTIIDPETGSLSQVLKYNGVATDCNECTTRGVYQATSSTLNTPSIFYLTDRTPILITFDGSFQLFFTGVELYSRAYCIDPHGVNSPHWSDWRNVADGGNASTVGGKNLTSIMNLGYQWDDRTQITDGDLDTYVDGGRYLVLSSDVAKNILHTPWTTTGYYLDIYRRTSTYVVQVAMRYGGEIKIRTIEGGSWSDWKNIADGGNADTLDGKHASDFTLSYIRNNKPLVTSILTLETVARLTWLPVDGATAYAVYLYIDGKYVTQSTSITDTHYDIQGLTPGTVYLALVRACVNDSWSSFNTDDLVHFYTMPVASATSDGLVTTGSQTFAGSKTFQETMHIRHSGYTKGSTAPSTMQFKAYRFLDKNNKQVGEFSNYVDTNNNTVSKMLAVAATSLDGKIYSQIATLINADASYICHVCTTPTTGRSSLRQMASGTAEATTSNCPSGAWYGKHS